LSEDQDATAFQCWAMAERVGTQIAKLPMRVRETAFSSAERCLREAGSERGVAGQQLDRIVELQMWAIRQIVAHIDISDVGGNPRSSRA
jgi:hypothetical protein